MSRQTGNIETKGFEFGGHFSFLFELQKCKFTFQLLSILVKM
jgi:hypothetical protein